MIIRVSILRSRICGVAYIIELDLVVLYYRYVIFLRIHGHILRFVIFEFIAPVEADVRIFHGLSYLRFQLSRVLFEVGTVVFGWL